MSAKLISIVSPVYNESEGITWFNDELCAALAKIKGYTYEIIYVNDGSKDTTLTKLESLKGNSTVSIKVVDLSRNFGKESALSAGIHESTGEAVLALDSDGQHPVGQIHAFLDKWTKGADVVVGVRESNQNEGIVKRHGSKLFYTLFNKITGTNLIPGSTDFRLLDRRVVDEFKKLEERNRITRGLIDWLGFRREYVQFHADERRFGTAGYTFKKLFELAVNTFVSLSAVPLFISGYLGIIFMAIGLIAGLFILIEQVFLGDPMNLAITGSAMVSILITFLVGVILSAQGLIGLYLARLLDEGQRRPLYVIRTVTKNKS